LYKKRIIGRPVFSFAFTNNQDDATAKKTPTLTLGGYDLPEEKSESDITWNHVTSPYFWSLELVNASVGNKTIPFETRTAVVDTGSSNLVMPSDDFKKVLSYFKKEMMCDQDKYGLYQCLCDDEAYEVNFPPIKI